MKTLLGSRNPIQYQFQFYQNKDAAKLRTTLKQGDYIHQALIFTLKRKKNVTRVLEKSWKK